MNFDDILTKEQIDTILATIQRRCIIVKTDELSRQSRLYEPYGKCRIQNDFTYDILSAFSPNNFKYDWATVIDVKCGQYFHPQLFTEKVVVEFYSSSNDLKSKHVLKMCEEYNNTFQKVYTIIKFEVDKLCSLLKVELIILNSCAVTIHRKSIYNAKSNNRECVA